MPLGGAVPRGEGRTLRRAVSDGRHIDRVKVNDRTIVSRSAMRASRGNPSQICSPGTQVGMAFISPWISAGASGLGSKVSCCGGEP